MSDSMRARPMTLMEQADLADRLASQWREPGSGFACNAVWLRREDVADLRTIAKTLRIFSIHGADDYVRAKVSRERGGKGKR